jgi:hypothetical protein
MTIEELQVLITGETAQLRKELGRVKQELNRADQEVKKSTRSINNTLRTIGATLATIGIGAFFKSATQEAIRFEAALMQIQRLMGSSANEFQRWVDTQAKAFGFARSEAIRYGAVYANLLSGFSSGTAETMRRTRDLLEASAIIASSTGRTMEDVMERIRSGLLGNVEAIEDLGVNVQVSLLESTKAFREFANGKSWNQLDFNTQQTIRYFAILEQTVQKYGNELAQNTATRQAQFIAQLKDIRLYLGQAFLPIYNTILPALTRMAAALANAARYLAAFMQALFGYKQPQQQISHTEDQATAVGDLGDAYEKAGKQAKKAVAGFDQLNLIGERAASKSGAGAIVPGVTGDLETNPFSQSAQAIDDMTRRAQQAAERVKDAFRGMFDVIRNGWNGVSGSAGQSLQVAWDAIRTEQGMWKEQFEVVFNDIIALGEPLKNWWQNDVIPLWGQSIETATTILTGLSESIRMVFGSLWDAAYPVLQKFVTDGLPRITDFVSRALDSFTRLFELAKDIFADIWQDAVDPALKNISRITQETLDIIFEWWDDWGGRIFDNVNESIEGIKGLWNKFWNEYMKPVVTRMLDMMSRLWDEHMKDLVKEVGDFIGKLIDGAQTIFNKFILPVVNWLMDNLKPAFMEVFDLVSSILETALGTIIDTAKGIIRALSGVIDFLVGVFTADWERAWNGIKNIFSGIGDALKAIFKGVVNVIVDLMNWVIKQVNKISIDIPEWVPEFGGKKFGINIPLIPKLATGTNYVPQDMLAFLHKGEAVVPKKYNPAADGVSPTDMTEVIAVLRQILFAIRDTRSSQGTIDRNTVGRMATEYINDLARRGQNPLAGAF